MKPNILVIIVSVGLIVGLFASGYSLATLAGRVSHYQGLQFTCYGVYVGSVSGHDIGTKVVDKFFTSESVGENSYPYGGWGYSHGKWYQKFEKVTTASFLGSSLDLDIDRTLELTPNLRVSVDVPRPSDLYEDEYGRGHVRSYEWEIDNEHYRMDLWIFETEINVAASADMLEKDGRFHGTDIWLKAEAFSPKYFYKEGEGCDLKDVYVGLAAIEVSEVRLGDDLFTMEEKEQLGLKEVNTPTSLIGVNVNRGLELFMSYQDPEPLVSGENPEGRKDEFEGFYYKGVRLNPEVFRKEYFVPIHLTSWGTEDGGWGPTYWWKADAMTIKCKVHLFTVGQWEVVKEEHEEWGFLVGQYGETSSWDKFLEGVGEFFSKFKLPIIIFAIIFFLVIIVIFLSWMARVMGR